MAAYAAHPSQFSTLFDYETMQPLIAGPPFVRALEELVAAAKTSSVELDQYTPESARRALMAGETAMVLTWPSRATTDNTPLPMTDGVRISFAELPGANTVYNFGEKVWTPRGEDSTSMHVPLTGLAGRLASVGKNARRPREAAGILALLSGPEWSSRIAPLSPATTLFRQSHVKNPELWTDEALPHEASTHYAEVARDSQTQPSSMSCPRIPGWRRTWPHWIRPCGTRVPGPSPRPPCSRMPSRPGPPSPRNSAWKCRKPLTHAASDWNRSGQLEDRTRFKYERRVRNRCQNLVRPLRSPFSSLLGRVAETRLLK